MPAGVIAEHRVTHPKITTDDLDEAEVLWYLQDRVIVPDYNFMLFGAAFYRDRYRKTPDGRKICATGYERTYEVAQKLDGKVTTGAALG